MAAMVTDWMEERLPPTQCQFYASVNQFLSTYIDYERQLDELETELLNNGEDLMHCLGVRFINRVYHNHLYQLLIDHGFMMDITVVSHTPTSVLFDCLRSLYLAKYYEDKFVIDSIVAGLDEEDEVIVFASLVTTLTETKQSEVLEFIVELDETLLLSVSDIDHSDATVTSETNDYKYIERAAQEVGSTIVGRDCLVNRTLAPNQYTIMELFNVYRDRFEKISLLKLPLELTALVSASTGHNVLPGSDIDKITYNIVSSPLHAEDVLLKIRGYCLRINRD